MEKTKDMENVMGILTKVANKAKDYVIQQVKLSGYKKTEDIQDVALKNLVIAINELDEVWNKINSCDIPTEGN